MQLNIGQQIKKYRKKRGLTQKELGERIGCDGRVVSFYECGKFNPAAHIIVALAEVLEITADELLRDNSHPKSKEQELLDLIMDLPPESQNAIKNLLQVWASNSHNKFK
ncbi:MAG: helix-turn-helix transcriptional regulator [Spirochaetota bacterium]